MTKRNSLTHVTLPDANAEEWAMPIPFAIEFVIRGTRDYLFSRWSPPPDKLKGEEIDESAERRMVWDCEGHAACSKLQVWNAVTAAGKYRPNPRSAKGSFGTVLREALEIESLGPDVELLTFIGVDGAPYEKWEWEDVRRVKKAGAFSGYVPRVRPALHAGWRLRGRAVVLMPEYVTAPQLHEAFSMAGRFGGIGDGRSGGLGFGRFLVEEFSPINDDLIEEGSG